MNHRDRAPNAEFQRDAVSRGSARYGATSNRTRAYCLVLGSSSDPQLLSHIHCYRIALRANL